MLTPAGLHCTMIQCIDTCIFYKQVFYPSKADENSGFTAVGKSTTCKYYMYIQSSHRLYAHVTVRV